MVAAIRDLGVILNAHLTVTAISHLSLERAFPLRQPRAIHGYNKKLRYRRGTARCVVSVEICQLPLNSAETTCTTSPEQRRYEVGGLRWADV